MLAESLELLKTTGHVGPLLAKEGLVFIKELMARAEELAEDLKTRDGGEIPSEGLAASLASEAAFIFTYSLLLSVFGAALELRACYGGSCCQSG